jgi:hypothetical protein
VRFFRVGLPALTGLLVIFVAVQSMRVALADSGAGMLDVAHAWLLPVAFAAGLLLTALAISRRTRSGYLLGVGLAVLMMLGGLAVIASEVPYLAGGGLGAALGAGVMILASAWILAWAVHGISMRRARASFTADWQPIDRQFGIVIASLAIFAAGAYLSLGFALSEEAAAGDASRADAAALVADTTIQAHVIAVTYAPSTDGASASEVEHLTLELSFMGAPAYALGQAPTVCLTDAATSRDPAYKPDVYCWGTAGPAVVLADGFSDLTMPSTARLIRLELERGGSLCAFGAGEWDAQVRIEPLVADAGTGIPEIYTRSTFFFLELPDGQAPPPSGTLAATDCLASTVSP